MSCFGNTSTPQINNPENTEELSEIWNLKTHKNWRRRPKRSDLGGHTGILSENMKLIILIK